jgi:hypothetical protein
MGLVTIRTIIAGPRSYSALFGGAAWSIAANVTEGDAKTAAKAVVLRTDGEWPLWHISYAVAGGVTQTCTLRMHYKDAEDEWHFLGILSMRNAFVAGDQDSQFIELVAPAGAQSVAMQVDDYTDGTWSIKVRGVM